MQTPLMHHCPGKLFTEMSTLEQMTILRRNRAERIPPEKPKPKEKKKGAGGKRKTTARKRKAANPEDKALKMLAKLPPAQRAKILAAMQAKQKG